MVAILEPLGLTIDSRSIELVKDINTGIKWLDKLAKEGDPEKLAIRSYVNNHRNSFERVSCSDCSGTGRYFDHHDDDGEASCPYCGGIGFYEKAV